MILPDGGGGHEHEYFLPVVFRLRKQRAVEVFGQRGDKTGFGIACQKEFVAEPGCRAGGVIGIVHGNLARREAFQDGSDGQVFIQRLKKPACKCVIGR